MTHPTRQIALSALYAPERPVRVTPAMAAAHDELVASISAHGLLEPLVVREGRGGTFNVVAGNRRLAALQALAGMGELSEDQPINCSVLVNGTDDMEASVAENTVRVAMHPADQAAAFRKIADAGATAEDIGIRFGLPRRTVEQRMRLGRLAEPILDAYREGKIDTELAQAYACTTDTDRQMSVWNELHKSHWAHHSNSVRTRLEAEKARSDSALGKFVGAKAYAAAGGTSEATLFADYSVLSDVELLEKLAREKLQRAADRERKKGWKWVATADEVDMRRVHDDYTRLYPQTAEATTAERAVLDEAERYFEEHNPDATGAELTEDQVAEWERHEKEYDEVRREVQSRRSFTDEQIAAAGVIFFVDHHGKAGRIEGLVREGDPVPGREDEPEPIRGAGGSTAAAPAEAPAEAPKPKGYSQGLRESIAELRNGVLRAELCAAPDVARDLLAFNLLLSIKAGYDESDDSYGGYYPTLPLSVSRETPPRNEVKGASAAINGYLAAPKLDMPWFDKSKPLGVLFEAYRSLDQATKDDLTARAVAPCLLTKPGGELTPYDTHAAIETELQPGYATHLLEVDGDVWNAETFWNRLRKDQIIDECRPCLGDEWAVGAAKLKKGELVKDAAERMKAHPAWLPKGMGAAERPEREP